MNKQKISAHKEWNELGEFMDGLTREVEAKNPHLKRGRPTVEEKRQTKCVRLNKTSINLLDKLCTQFGDGAGVILDEAIFAYAANNLNKGV
jgi:hypothetical protein